MKEVGQSTNIPGIRHTSSALPVFYSGYMDVEMLCKFALCHCMGLSQLRQNTIKRNTFHSYHPHIEWYGEMRRMSWTFWSILLYLEKYVLLFLVFFWVCPYYWRNNGLKIAFCLNLMYTRRKSSPQKAAFRSKNVLRRNVPYLHQQFQKKLKTCWWSRISLTFRKKQRA